MDFSQLDTVKASEHTSELTVLHPVTGEETDVTIRVYGSQSDAVKKFGERMLRKMQKQELENNRSRKPKFREIDELQADAIESVLVRIAGWENMQWAGKELEFTEENARMVLTQCPWLREQVIEHSEDLGNYLKA